MAYLPNNIYVYLAAFIGAQSGILGQANQSSLDVYTSSDQIAGAWAQAVDTAWNDSANPDLYQQGALAGLSKVYWLYQNPIAAPASTNPDTYVRPAANILLMVQSGESYLSGESIPPIFPTFNSAAILVNQLASLRPTTTDAVQSVNGNSRVADGGQGDFFWSAASTATPDGATCVAVTGVATGRWLRIFDGTTFNVQWYGANSASADCTAAVTACFAAAASVAPPGVGTVIFPPASSYTFNGALAVPQHINVVGGGYTTRLLFQGAGNGLVWTGSGGLCGALSGLVVENIGAGLDGLAASLLISASVTNCLFVGWTQRGIAFIDCSVTKFEDNVITDCGSATYAAVEVDSAAVGVGGSQNVAFTWINNYITNNPNAVAGLRLDRGGPFTVIGGAIENSGIQIQISAKAETRNGTAGIEIHGLDIEIVTPSAATPAFIEIGYGLTGVTSSNVFGVTISGNTLVADVGGIPYGIKCKYTNGFSFFGNYMGTERTGGTTLASFWFEGLTNSNMFIFGNTISTSGDPYVVVNGVTDKSALPTQPWSYSPMSMGGGQFGGSSMTLPGPPVMAPSAPSAGYVVFIDVADGKLKAIGSSGTLTILAVP